ncbi:MAG: methylmalonyl-CoA epimerase [Halobacteriales archaeon]|nr:methylmalonyl-CoA epimerase [Halobacteriales archaeon]
MRLDHVGVATDDAAALAELLGGLLDAPVVHEEEFDGLGVVFLEAGEPSIELLEPLGAEGPVARFLDRRGPGLHHLAFEVDDVAAALDAATAAGIEAIDETPRPGARGHTVAFLHPGSTGGVLVEFVEH